MAKPKVLQKLDNHVNSSDDPHLVMGWVSTEDELEVDDIIPVDADTLQGHPVSYFASKAEVNAAIASYVSTVLGTSY